MSVKISLKQQKKLGCRHRMPDRCRTCRTDADWRERVAGVREFDCPHGVTADNLPASGRVEGRRREAIGEIEMCLAEARAKVCETCSHKRSVTRQKNGFDVYAVKCNKCGCGGLSLVRGNCPQGLWATLGNTDSSKRAQV